MPATLRQGSEQDPAEPIVRIHASHDLGTTPVRKTPCIRSCLSGLRRNRPGRYLWSVLFIAWSVFSVCAEEAAKPSRPPAQVVQGFLKTYCLECHNTDAAEGQREFESFAMPFTTPQQLISADEIIDQVTLGQMPPADAERPGDQERLAVVEALRKALQEARDRFEATGGRTVVRRLSHREYEKTLEVLLGRRIDTLGLTADFPSETTKQHIDHIGAEMKAPGVLLDQYFQAADRLVEMRLNKPVVEPKTWQFHDHFVQYEELDGPHKSVFKHRYLCLYEQPNTDTRQGGYGHIEDFLEGVPVSGLYDIEVHAQAMHRDTHYDPKIFRIDFSEPFQLAIVPGDVTKGHIHYPQAIEPRLGEAIVPDEAPGWLTFRVWLEAGQTPRFIFPNGPYESRASVIELNKRYAEELEIEGKKIVGVDRSYLLRKGKLPHIRIDEIKIHGPLPEPKGTAEELAVFGPGGFQEDQAFQRLAAFARRAYRRPLDKTDRERLKRLYAKRLEEGATARQAALDTVKMILCSPSFLYLTEGTPEDEALLRPYDLAARLSYTLWARPPDKRLSAVAKSGEILDVDVLKAQVERMLADQRASAFVDDFVDSWLNLRDIGSLPPPRQTAGEYYALDLPTSMKQEARLFFAELLKSNGPITDFLDADYTFVDKKLAGLYQLPERETLRLADGFQRVKLDDRRQRGGVLGMAGVLTVSANGVDTSPVTRGVWVLENLLGTPPPPPPDEVPAIDSDVNGATTMRERLAKHSADPACYVCHRKIDPMGFALEAFDPIGRRRANYPKAKTSAPALKVDTTGTLPSGDRFENFGDFKQLLVKQRSAAFKRHLIETLLSYATGRLMERVDRFEIDDIVARVEADRDGLRTAVVESLTSRIFRSR
jgi:hypothetical protein